MSTAIYQLSDGRINRIVHCLAGVEDANTGDGEAWLAVDESVCDSTHYISQGAATLFPAAPSVQHSWDWKQRCWRDARSLGERRAAQWQIIKSARDQAMAEPLTTPYGVFDASPAASASIVKAAARAERLKALGAPDGIDFTLADNSVATLGANEMAVVWQLLDEREQGLRQRANTLRQRIASAETSEKVDSALWADA